MPTRASSELIQIAQVERRPQLSALDERKRTRANSEAIAKKEAEAGRGQDRCSRIGRLGQAGSREGDEEWKEEVAKPARSARGNTTEDERWHQRANGYPSELPSR